MQSVFLPDLDRIEVIRGPGTSIWGSNAVNGIINVITRDAFQTVGTVALAGTGNGQDQSFGFRHGMLAGDRSAVRVYGAHNRWEPSELESGQGEADDAWKRWHVGMRWDSALNWRDRLYLVTDYVCARPESVAEDSKSFQLSASWRREDSPGNFMEMRGSIDHLSKDFFVHQDTRNLSFNFHFAKEVSDRYALNTGLGIKSTDAEYFLIGNPVVLEVPREVTNDTLNAFVQHRLTLLDETANLLVGLKWEHDGFVSHSWHPTLRLTLEPSETMTLWIAATRTLRNPSFVERNADFQVIVSAPSFRKDPEPGLDADLLEGNPNLDAETMNAVELGVRQILKDAFTLDLAFYYQQYHRIINDEEPASGSLATRSGSAAHRS